MTEYRRITEANGTLRCNIPNNIVKISGIKKGTLVSIRRLNKTIVITPITTGE